MSDDEISDKSINILYLNTYTTYDVPNDYGDWVAIVRCNICGYEPTFQLAGIPYLMCWNAMSSKDTSRKYLEVVRSARKYLEVVRSASAERGAATWSDWALLPSDVIDARKKGVCVLLDVPYDLVRDILRQVDQESV